jgi:putative ABC transport system ATP-binding protein
MSGPPSVLELSRVGKEFPGPLRVLRDVHLTVRAGELVSVVGPSGSGKTTLLQIMGTLDIASEGDVRVAGQDVGEIGDDDLAALRAHHVGFVFQQFFLIGSMTASQNVGEGLLYRGVPRTERRARAVSALERVGLSHRADHPAAKLSGGERQRVAIARAIVGRPTVVFADEPTGNLDTRTGAQIVELLRELNRAGTTIVLVTHDRDVAAAMPRRIALRDGAIESDDGAPT